MKKKFALLCVFLFALCFTGCEKVEKGDYKEGTYFAGVVDNYGGQNNVATAVVVVNKSGVIESVFLDTTYAKGDTVTTKKTLGNEYGMKTYNQSAAGEWFEEVKAFEKAVVEKQGLDGITLNSDGKTDAVSGCTIKIDALYKALEQALKEAK